MKNRYSTLSKLIVAIALAGSIVQPVYAQTAQAAPAAAGASADEALAGKLKGQWAGKWEIGNFGGKFVLIISAAEGTTLKGEGHWYGTASGDTKEPLKSAQVKDGELIAEQAGGTKFKMKLQGDDKLEGKWELQGYNGPLTASKQP